MKTEIRDKNAHKHQQQHTKRHITRTLACACVRSRSGMLCYCTHNQHSNKKARNFAIQICILSKIRISKLGKQKIPVELQRTELCLAARPSAARVQQELKSSCSAACAARRAAAYASLCMLTLKKEQINIPKSHNLCYTPSLYTFIHSKLLESTRFLGFPKDG